MRGLAPLLSLCVAGCARRLWPEPVHAGNAFFDFIGLIVIFLVICLGIWLIIWLFSQSSPPPNSKWGWSTPNGAQPDVASALCLSARGRGGP